MKRVLMIFMLSGLVGACATSRNPLPENYTGPKATMRDSVTNYNGAKADYFFLYQYNGTSIRQTYDVSVENSSGTGFTLLPPEIIERTVPASEGRYYLIGRTHYAAPIQELAHDIYMVKGEIKFSPEAGGSYVIRGTLNPSLAEIWIEDETTGRIVSKKLSTSLPKSNGAAQETDAGVAGTQ